MDREALTAKLLDLVEGRETPETWRSWWDEHEPELEALLNRGEFLKLKPCRHDFRLGMAGLVHPLLYHTLVGIRFAEEHQVPILLDC